MRATLRLYKDFEIGKTDKRLFGSFVEHLGRAIYGGIFEPGHPTAGPLGFRKDVLDMVRELQLSVIRYPGGNYVSAYTWEDTIGPVEKRPRRLDFAWQSLEPNTVGLHEFSDWAGLAGVEIMMAMNLGTRGIRDACNLIEYCNHPGGSYWSDLRKSNGKPDPFGIKLWCLGNEMDGPWQIGQKTADEYGRIAFETAKALKLFDPGLELVACGSSTSKMPTYPQWEATVLEHCYEKVDYISTHQYYKNRENDQASFLASSIGMERFVSTTISTCDFVKAKLRSRKTLNISFDEWNVWYHSEDQDLLIEPWAIGPPKLEDIYNMEDALVVGTLVNTLLRHADRVKIACLAQLVNVIAPIMTVTGGPAWRQSTFWPFLHMSLYGRGTSLRTLADVDRYDNKTYGEVPYLDTAAVYDDEHGVLNLFVANIHPVETIVTTVDAKGFGRFDRSEHTEMRSDDPKACNDANNPNRVKPSAPVIAKVAPGPGQTMEFQLKPLSWNVIRIFV